VKTERIGNVTVTYLDTDDRDAPVYSDGAHENRLYEKFMRDPNYKGHRGDEVFSSWVEEYHLSPVRHNLLKWFPFDPQGTVLEVGAGCGALTGLLCEKVSKVTALEYSERRALITAMRHSQQSNLEVIVGGLQDFLSDQRFDYITVIGVLEYAGRFYGRERPHESFLAKLKDMLNPKGALILAIENKIGLKYICGAQEDHTGRVFESIYGYPYSSGVSTFSKKELGDLLDTAGFGSLEWYYPFPDYKMPQEVLSDEVAPGDTDSVWRLFPARTGRQRRKEIISERRFGKALAQAGLIGEFSNSFLVVARAKEVPGEFRCIRFIGANTRRKHKFRTYKQVCMDGRGRQFILGADNADSAKFLREIVVKEALAKKYFGDAADVVTGQLKDDRLIYPYMPFPAMSELIAEAINEGDPGFGRVWIDEYLRLLMKLPAQTCIPQEFVRELGISSHGVCDPVPCLCCGIIDCVPHNIMVDERSNKYYIIDNEFTYDFPVPIDFMIWRAVCTLVVNLQSQIQSNVCRARPVVVFMGYGHNRHYIPLGWLDVLTSLDIPTEILVCWSSAFQNMVNRRQSRASLRLKAKPRPLKRVPLAELEINKTLISRACDILRKLKQTL